MTTIFLSHASQDGALVDQLSAWLAQNGFTDLFVDHDRIRVGDRWADALRNAKASCRVVLCVVTPAWLESDECYAEFLAGWYAGKRIMPLLATSGTALNERQQHRIARLLREDQGFDLTAVGAPHTLDFDSQSNLSAVLIAGLKAGGALARIGLDPMAFEIDTKTRPDPFPGLESFGDADADAAIFFGRSPEIATCIEDLREMRASGDRRAYTIVGASGSGKSSLMKAGVLPRLRRERGWLVLRFFRPGGDPLYSFAEAIARTAAHFQLTWAPGVIHEELLAAWRAERQAHGSSAVATNPSSDAHPQGNAAVYDGALVATVERRIAVLRDRANMPATTCLIAIDQAEELAHNLEESGNALGDYISALCAAPADEGAPIPYSFVLTARDDGFSELRASAKFARVLTRTADIRTLPLYRFASAIEQPAERYGVSMELSLVQVMIDDAPETDALPLLAFALRRLWTRFAAERQIRKINYEQLGKLPGLIEDAAERASRGMDPRDDSPLTPPRVPAEREKQLMRLFVPGLAQLNERGLPIRRLAAAESFSEDDKALLAPFMRWRLLTARGDTIEVSHEAMFREWSRFAEWLKPERERLEALRGVEAAAETWEAQRRKPEYLSHRKQRLKAAEALWEAPDYKRQIATNASLKAYLGSCRTAERRRLASILAIIVLLAGTAMTLIATNLGMIGTFIETTENAQAALPGASFANNAIRDEFELRRNLLRGVLQRYITYALEGVVPTSSDSVAAAAKILLQTRAGVAANDPWSIGQIAAALGKGAIPTDQLQTYFDQTFIPQCACWSPIDGDQHLGATAWIIIGQLTQGVPVRPAILDAILNRQSKDGGWPLFFEATKTSESNSTYATALLLLALHELSVAAEVEPPLRARIQTAIDHARDWLHARAPKNGEYWIDYPDSARRTVPSRGNSAFVVDVLITTGNNAEDRRLFSEWFAKLGAPTNFDQMDTSDQFVNLVDGKVRRDGTRYLTLNWELAAIGKGSAQLDGFERIRARRFFLDALSAWPRDQTGRFDFLTAETLFAINTLFDGGALSAAAAPH
jgi:TIR domain